MVNLHDAAATASKMALSKKEQGEVLAQVENWSANDWMSLEKRARDEVVIPQIYKNLEQLDKKPPVWDRLKALYYNTWVHKQNLLSESRRIADCLSQRDLEFLFLKGMAIGSLYTRTWRAMADIDVLVKDFNGAKEALSEIGYLLDDLWAANGGEFGVADLYCVKRRAKIDLHFGKYPVHSLGSFHLPLWERKKISSGIPILSYEDNLLVLAAHVFNHGFYLMRDINDIYAMVQEKVDWTYVSRQARTLGLQTPLCVLLKATSSVYGTDLKADCRGSSSFLYRYGCRKHTFQSLLQPHHLLHFSQVKKIASYPGYLAHSFLFNNEGVIDPPWIGRASPAWINRIDRKQLCPMDGQMFHALFGEQDAVLLYGIKMIFDSGTVYVEKQNLLEKDLGEVRRMVKGVTDERTTDQKAKF